MAITGNPGAAFPMIASHRGGALVWPENSRTAFTGTLGLDVELVEFDVQRSRDGELVIFHDALVDRVTDGSGAVSGKLFAELRSLTLNGTDGDQILTLDETIAIFQPSSINLRLEIKPGVDLAPYFGIEAEIAARLDRTNMLARTQITSFRLPSLPAFRSVAKPGLGLLWLVSQQVDRLIDDDASLIDLARKAGATGFGFHIDDLTRERVSEVRAAGFTVGSWATHDEASIKRAADLGVDVFTTDRPDIALLVRNGETAAALG